MIHHSEKIHRLAGQQSIASSSTMVVQRALSSPYQDFTVDKAS